MKKRRLSWLLVFAMIFNLVSFSTVSADSDAISEWPSATDISMGFTEENTVSISKVPDNIKSLVPDPTADKIIMDSETEDEAELFTLRTINSETGEGTITVYSVPVKYMDSTGKMQFIDTSMKPVTAAESVQSGFIYRNAANSFLVEFGNTASKGINFDNAFIFEVNSNTVSSKTAQIQNSPVQAENGHGKIIYPNAFGPNTKVEYINTEGGLKENIILNEYTGQNRFDFTFRSETHVPVLVENGKYLLIADKNNPNKIDYRFLSLYAYDSYDPAKDSTPSNQDFRHMNEDLYYELTDNEDGTYTITVVVPEAYLSHPEIVYPVTIDPSLEPYVSSNGNAQDTFVDAATPSTQNNGNLDYIRFGKVSGYKNFGYHRFTSLPAIPTGASVTSAYLKFTFRSGQTTPAKNSGIRMRVRRITGGSWTESSITWNNKPSTTSSTSVDIAYNGSYLDYFDANITSMVQAWYSGSSNYGIDFTYSNEDYNDYNSVVSSEGEAHRAPTLTVTYTYSYASGISSNKVYYIKAAHSGLYLDVDGSASKSSNVMQYGFHGDQNQQWKVVYQGNGYYKLYSMSPSYKNKCLDVQDLSSNNIDVYPDGSGDWLLWAIVPNGDGSYRLVNKWSEKTSKVLTVSLINYFPAANVIQSTWYGGNSQKWYFEPRSSKGMVNHSGVLYMGMSSDNYLNNTCGFGSRVSSQCADYFGQFLGGTGYNNVTFSALFNRKNGSASKNDFLSKAFHPNSNANIDDVDFMLFVGHGRADYGLHFTNGVSHGAVHDAANLNLPRSEATFGYGNAKTKWVAAYTCNFLTGSNDSVYSMFKGVNVVLGYASASFLVRDQMGTFAQKLKPGGNIIDSWIDAGTYHTQYAPNDVGTGILKAVYVSDARNDTLYNYLKAAGEYGVEVISYRTKSYPPRA